MPARTVTVSVTADDITKGTRCRADSCMLQRALARALGDKTVAVSYYAPSITDPAPLAFVRGSSTDSFIANLPAPCGEAAIAFDAGKPVQPFSFELTLP